MVANEKPTAIEYVAPSTLSEHPEAWRIPEMSPDEWADFNESVRSRGAITDPVFALPDGRVFDGRHRLRAATENELPAMPVIVWDISEEAALDRMRISATERRSLRPGQKVMVNLEFGELLQRLREEARSRQGERTDLSAVLQGSPGGANEHTSEVAEHIAQMSGISARSVYKAQAVLREAPDLAERVKLGEITINRAETELRKRKQSKQPPDELRPTEKPSPQTPKSATRAKLDEIKRTVESDEPLDDVPGESTLSPNNLLRYRANGGIMRFAADFCADYEALKEADPETVRQYLIRLKRIIYGSLLIAAEYDESQELRDVFAHMAYLAECALSDEGALALVTTIQKGGNVA